MTRIPMGTMDAEHATRMEQLRHLDPEARILIGSLPRVYQEHITLAFPIHGEQPFVGVEIGGKLMQPADPTSYRICCRLMEMLLEENPDYIRRGMEQAHKQRGLYSSSECCDG